MSTRPRACTHKRGHWAEYPPLVDDGRSGRQSVPIAKTPPTVPPKAGFLCSVRGGALSLHFPHPSRDSQLMSRLATAITIPVMSTAKQETEGHSGENAYRRLPFNLPVHGHLDIPRFGPSFDTRLTNRHELFHASRKI